MNIETLRFLTLIMEEQSISKVSEKVHVSQSALSQHVKAIETNLNVQLINRTNRGITATKEGEILYRYAKNIIECYDLMLSELETKDEKLSMIKIYSTPLFSSYALPCTLFDLQRQFPDIHIDMNVLPSSMITQKIASGEGDIGFVNGLPSNSLLCFEPVLKDPIYLVAEYGYSIDNVIESQQIIQLPLIMSSGHSITKENIQNALIKNSINVNNLNVKYHMDTTESVKLSVLNKHGLSFLPYSSIKKELYLKQLKIVEVKNLQIYNEFYMIINRRFTSKNKHLSEIIQYIQNALSDTLC